MSYLVKFAPSAQETLDRLPSEITERIINKLSEAKEFPEHYLIRLKGTNEFKLRVGDYRAIILADMSNRVLKVQAIGHRKNIYKKYKTD